jgi:hypothetical protein
MFNMHGMHCVLIVEEAAVTGPSPKPLAGASGIAAAIAAAIVTTSITYASCMASSVS